MKSRLFGVSGAFERPWEAFVSALLVSHPAFFLLTVCNGLRRAGAGNIYGAAFIGVLLGLMLLRLRKKLNPDLTSAASVIFLAAPIVLFLLSSDPGLFAVNFNTNLFWLVFIFIYLTAGAVLFIKTSTSRPDVIVNKADLYAVALCVPFLIFALLVNFIMRGAVYSVDSYSYYEMSRTIFGDFGLVNTTRQYIVFTDYGISFPYLFPAVIAVFDFFTGFGMFSGVCVNLAAALISFYFILKISRRLSGSPIPGLIVSFVLFFNADYLGEMVAARAVPLSLLCALLVLYCLSGPAKPGKKELFSAGLFAGAGMVVRFDFMVISGLLAIGLLFIYKKNFIKPVVFYALGLLVFTAPWMVYSIARFGALWISDNGGTLFLIHPQIPQRYFTPNETIPDMFSDFNAWFSARQHILIYGLAGFFTMITKPVESVLLLGAAGAGILAKGSPDKKIKPILIFTLLIYAAKSAAIFLVGYGDIRYHTETLIIVALALLCAFYAARSADKIWPCFLALVFAVSLISHFQPTLKDYIQPKLNNAFIGSAAMVPDPDTLEVADILAEESGDIGGVRLFFIYSGDDYSLKTNPYKLGAFTNVKSYARINNINEERLLYLFEYYIMPNYIFVPKGDSRWVDILSEHYLIDALQDAPYLYAVGGALETLGENSVRLSGYSDRNWVDGVSVRSPILLLRNTEENYSKLENAAALEAGGVRVRVTSFYSDDDWINISCGAEIRELEPFAYPNVINILE